MKPRFLLPFVALACLLGVMLSIVAGHVVSVVHDWAEATYRMTNGAYLLTTYPNPDGDAPNARRSATVNKELRALVDGQDIVVVLDGLDGDGPRLGLYDPTGRFADTTITKGRGFAPADFQAPTATALVRSDSYLVGREDRYIPSDIAVIGYYDEKSSPFRNEYVYSLFTQENVHGAYYIDAADPTLASRFSAVLTEHGYVVEAERIDPNVWSIVQSEPLTYAYEASLILVYGSALLLCTQAEGQQGRRETAFARGRGLWHGKVSPDAFHPGTGDTRDRISPTL